MTGYTKEERFLANLARKSFLRFWSWPNLFRDQRTCGGKGDGKELCDLIVIFGKEVLFFSDKKIKFNIDKPLAVAWSRWAREAIRESIAQVRGAKRWLTNFPDRIFLDKNCLTKLPLKLPLEAQASYHYIVVCHGAERAAIHHTGTPSFAYLKTVNEQDHWNSNKCMPFTIGNVSCGEFVHVFNEATIELVLREFDTIYDFVHYLNERKILLMRENIKSIKCEGDIIQLHYENINSETKLYSASSFQSSQDQMVVDKGGVARLYSIPEYVAKKQADKISYFWDDLIEAFSFHVLNGTAERRNWEYPHEIEPALRVLASASRFQRRLLTTAFQEFYEKIEPGKRGTRVVLDPFDNSLAYIFFLFPHLPSMGTNDEYRQLRHNLLQDYLLINKYLHRDLASIVIIGAKTKTPGKRLTKYFIDEGQDFALLECGGWNDEDYTRAKVVYDMYVNKGLIVQQQLYAENVRDFPELRKGYQTFRAKYGVKGSERNKPCLCGSGLKYKKCCGRAS